jgi:hypothetical protein
MGDLAAELSAGKPRRGVRAHGLADSAGGVGGQAGHHHPQLGGGKLFKAWMAVADAAQDVLL